MSLFSSLQVSASGMSAQRTRAEILVENMANAETTRTPEGGPYKRKDVVFTSDRQASPFSAVFQSELSQGVPVDARCLDCKAIRELLQPLIAQAGRSEHEHARDHATHEQLGRDQASLDRLAEAHLVGEQDPRTEPAKNRHRRLQLMREEIDLRRSRSSQRSGRAVTRDQGAAGAAPGDRAHDPRPRRASDRLDSVKGNEDAALETHLRQREAAQRDNLAVLVRADVHDAPPRTAHHHEIARPNTRVVVSVRWRNLHRASATRAQIVRRAFGAPSEIKNLRLASGRRGG